MRIYKLYGAALQAGVVNAAMAEIVAPGRITGIQYTVEAMHATPAEEIGSVELNFMPVDMIHQDRSAGDILSVACPAKARAVNGFVPMNLKVAPGERLYVNSLASDITDLSATFRVQVEE